MMAKYKISGLPVVDADNVLIGIITNRDVKYQENLDMKVEEIMTKENLITSDKNTNLEKQKKSFLRTELKNCLS
jgi:IMP dehydrogenase